MMPLKGEAEDGGGLEMALAGLARGVGEVRRPRALPPSRPFPLGLVGLREVEAVGLHVVDDLRRGQEGRRWVQAAKRRRARGG
ncbi:unnamed protein product [Phytomonas sp. Hart1]|nr:unnamed protein product [Phytomonas sp. Hart1]|eukprot:CCW71890.1 unnamed protein product [Phytomonas sp. isolate Hart1]